MCGRFTISMDPDDLETLMDLTGFAGVWEPRFNVAPSQKIPVLTDATSRVVEYYKWGLIPSWAKDPSIGNRMINARAETLTEKPSFKQAFARRRCLILADGFYEWKKDASKKSPSQPYYFTLKDGSPFTFAGLWEAWNSPDGDIIKSATIITTSANEVVAPIHERMPVMLDVERCWDWLKPSGINDLQHILAPFPPDRMQARPVSRLVNDPEKDSVELLR